MAIPPRQAPPAPMSVFADDEMPSRGFLGQVSLILFQPKQFFHKLSTTRGRQWLWAAILILALIAYSAVLQTSNASPSLESGIPPMDSGGMPPFEGEFTPDTSNPSTGGASDPTAAWMTALTSIGSQVIYWAILALVLSEVSLFKGRRPKLSLNLQIAIWSSLPLALMAGLQIIFNFGGGKIGTAGFAGFLASWDAYNGMNIYLQSLLYALASQFTVFWLWSLALIYLGARETLKGKFIPSVLVLLMWLTLVLFAYSAQSYQKLTAAMPIQTDFPMEGEIPLNGEFPLEGELGSEGEMPSFEMPEDFGGDAEQASTPEAVHDGRKG